ALSLSTDGSLLAVSTGSDILIYSTEGGLTLNQTLKGHTGYVSNVEWYPGETKLVSGSSLNGRYSSREEVVWFWDLNKGSTKVFRLEGHTDAIMWVGASPDGKLIATSSWDSTVKIWDISDGSLIKTLKGIKGQSWTGCWSPDSRFIAVGGGDRTVRVWDVRSGETVHAFGEDERLFSGWVRGLAFEASEGEYLTTAADGGTVRVFDMASGN
ncbi:WD40 repeat-like protein, partial [Ramaria rubella]